MVVLGAAFVAPGRFNPNLSPSGYPAISSGFFPCPGIAPRRGVVFIAFALMRFQYHSSVLASLSRELRTRLVYRGGACAVLDIDFAKAPVS